MHEANFGPSRLSSPWSSGARFPPWGRRLSALSALPASFHSVLSLAFHCEHRCCAVQCHLDGVSSSFLHPDADPVDLEWGSRSFLSSRFPSDAKKIKGGIRWWMRTPATKCRPLTCAMDLEMAALFSSIGKGEGNPVLCLVSNSFKIQMTALCLGC